MRLQKLHNLPCADCPFRPEGLKLGPEKMNEIYGYLLQGTNHLCHSDRTNHTICRGGRDWQLTMLARLGLIAQPSDAALEGAMLERGVIPSWTHV